MCGKSKLLGASLLYLLIVLTTLRASAKRGSRTNLVSPSSGHLTESVKHARCTRSLQIFHDASDEESVASNSIMSIQHTSRAYIQGYAMTLTKCSKETDSINYVPFLFTSMELVTLPDDPSEITATLLGANSSLKIKLTNGEDPGAPSWERYNSRYRLHTFQSIYFNDTRENIECLVERPHLSAFKYDEYYACDARRVLTCNHTGYPDEIVLLMFDQMHIEVNGNHDKIFSGAFSKKRRSCVDAIPYKGQEDSLRYWTEM